MFLMRSTLHKYTPRQYQDVLPLSSFTASDPSLHVYNVIETPQVHCMFIMRSTLHKYMCFLSPHTSTNPLTCTAASNTSTLASAASCSRRWCSSLSRPPSSAATNAADKRRCDASAFSLLTATVANIVFFHVACWTCSDVHKAVFNAVSSSHCCHSVCWRWGKQEIIWKQMVPSDNSSSKSEKFKK